MRYRNERKHAMIFAAGLTIFTLACFALMFISVERIAIQMMDYNDPADLMDDFPFEVCIKGCD